MESTYSAFNIIIGFWIATVLMAVCTVYIPAIRIIGALDKNNIAYRYKWLGGVIFTGASILLAPVWLFILFNDRQRERFLSSFIPAFMGEADE